MPVKFVDLDPGSDGDASKVPPDEWSLVHPPNIYLSKIAEQWLETRGGKEPGIRYYLKRLPNGYRLYQKPRINNPNIIDKHLYGHPTGKYFDSPNRFFPHFAYLVEHGNNRGCPCTLCSSSHAKPVPHNPRKLTSNEVSLSKSRLTVSEAIPSKTTDPRNDTFDEEGTPDVIGILLKELKRRPIDEEISEPSSLDWISTGDELKSWMAHLRKLPSWMPRQGEIVLFVRKSPEPKIDYDNGEKVYKEFDEKSNEFLQLPSWEAGVVAQDSSESVGLADLVQQSSGNDKNITFSGFRIEPLSHPNQCTSQPLNKGHKYVPLHHIRPFEFWQELLKGHPEDTWHPTIHRALRMMSSVCLVDKHRLRGTWPHAEIFCAGIYIGAQFLCAGDTIAIIPSSGDAVQDFLEIKTIKFRLTNTEDFDNSGLNSSNPYNSIVLLMGKGFTLNPSHAWTNEPIGPRAPKSLTSYNRELYSLHDPTKSMQIPFLCVLGRCYDAQAMLVWFPPSNSQTELTDVLSYGVDGVRTARKISSSQDNRILPGKTWFWGDSRLEVLELETLNNVYSSRYDELREEKLEEWKYRSVNKKPRGRPPKLEKHAMAIGRSRAFVVSGSENETDEKHDEENSKKRSFSAVTHDSVDDWDIENTDDEVKPVLAGNETLKPPNFSSRWTSQETSKKPRVVVVLDD